MRTLGLLFILCGLWLCFTILLAWPGAVAIGLGALCYIAGRTTSPSRVARVANVSLGVLIALSITFAAVAFIGLASGVKPSEHTAPAAQMSSEWRQAFSTQPQHAKPAKASRGR